jgi:hypothetical protein
MDRLAAKAEKASAPTDVLRCTERSWFKQLGSLWSMTFWQALRSRLCEIGTSAAARPLTRTFVSGVRASPYDRLPSLHSRKRSILRQFQSST